MKFTEKFEEFMGTVAFSDAMSLTVVTHCLEIISEYISEVNDGTLNDHYDALVKRVAEMAQEIQESEVDELRSNEKELCD